MFFFHCRFLRLFSVVLEMWKPPDREVRRLFFMACT
nr:MAG TPA: hypothetical protein [Bacteriophage sp.]